MANKICEECKMEFFYDPPVGYPDKRKYCKPCSDKKKTDWDNKDKAPVSGVPPEQVITIPVAQPAIMPDKTTTRDHKYDKDPVGLSVDLFIASLGDKVTLEPQDCEHIMKTCIDLVKYAQKEFN